MENNSQNELAENLPDIDVRSIAIIWGDDDPLPRVTWSGCNGFEALGMIRVAIRRLERHFEVIIDDEDEDDEYDDD